MPNIRKDIVACGNCRYYNAELEYGPRYPDLWKNQGICKLNPPVISVIQPLYYKDDRGWGHITEERILTNFPEVKELDVCGQFITKEIVK